MAAPGNASDTVDAVLAGMGRLLADLVTAPAKLDKAIDNVLDKGRAALEAAAIDDPEGNLLARVLSFARTEEQFRGDAIVGMADIAAKLWDRKEANFDLFIECLVTIGVHPEQFGTSMLVGGLGFYVQDLVATFELGCRVALTLATANGCLVEQTLSFAGIEDFGKILAAVTGGGACDDMRAMVEALDKLRAVIMALVPELSLDALTGLALDLVKECFDFIIAILRFLPEAIDGPFAIYGREAAKDPVQLGRICGITAAILIGFAVGIEEVLVFATGYRALRPVIIIGGMFGNADGVGVPGNSPPASSGGADGAEGGTGSGGGPGTGAGGGGGSDANDAPMVVRTLKWKILEQFGEMTQQERQLVRWLLEIFAASRETRRLEQAGVELQQIRKAIIHRARMPEAMRRGFRAVDQSSMKAARDVAEIHPRVCKIVKGYAGTIRNVIRNQRYAIAPYRDMRRTLGALNSELEALWYVARSGELGALERLDLRTVTAELHNTLFEAAHVIDSAFVTKAGHEQWESVRRFKARIPRWFKSGNTADNMETIALLATEHRVLPLGTVDPWGVLDATLTSAPVTTAMERLIVFSDSRADDVTKAAKGAFVVGPNTTATEIVLVQQLIYSTEFPQIYPHLSDTLKSVMRDLDEPQQLAWTIPANWRKP